MSNVFFTSDTHFGHEGILGFRTAFTTVREMNECLIDQWNAVVKSGDRVYHLGDFALWRRGDEGGLIDLCNRLRGQIYLIRGNHDSAAEHRLVRGRFVWIRRLEGLTVEKQFMVMCHYAMRTWDRAHYGSWQLHGHSHGGLAQLPGYKQMDVGVDCHGFTPISFEQVRAVMATKTFAPVDHHTEELAAKSA